MPKTVTSSSGEVIYTLNDIETGQNVWQSIGGMEQGSIWGMVVTSRQIGAQHDYIGKPRLC
jgi:nitric oxide reductase large subunit